MNKLIYFLIYSREMHKYNNVPNAERESKYIDKHLYNDLKERRWKILKII